jgi:predicted  nucleic acid-binding Zn-ribbon protein
MKTRDELEQMIEDLQEQIEQKQDELNNLEIDAEDYEDQYNDMLDECYPELFNMLPSDILRQCDPIAYRCGLVDYVYSIDIRDTNEYQELEQEIEDLEDELSDLEDELSDLEDEDDE